MCVEGESAFRTVSKVQNSPRATDAIATSAAAPVITSPDRLAHVDRLVVEGRVIYVVTIPFGNRSFTHDCCLSVLVLMVTAPIPCIITKF